MIKHKLHKYHSKVNKNKYKKRRYFLSALAIIFIISIFTVLYYTFPAKKTLDVFVVGNESGKVDLNFTPSTIELKPNDESTIELTIDPGDTHPTGAQVEIDYDSTKLGVPLVTQGDYFTYSLSPASTTNNKIKFAYIVPVELGASKSGKGTIVKIKIKPLVTGSTSLNITENTIVTIAESQTNSLKSVTNASINIVNASADSSAAASTNPTTISSADPSTPASSTPSTLVTPQKPTKPTGLSSNCYDGGTKITLRWDTVTGATSYKVRMDQKDGNKDISVDNIKNTEYNAGIMADTKYSWWVHSVKDGLDSEEAKINEVSCAKPSTTSNPTPTATPKDSIKATPKVTPKPTSTPKSNVSNTPKPSSISTNSLTPTPSAIGSLNDIFGEKPEEDVSNSSIETGLFAKIALGWQAIFLKLVELFK